MIEMKNLFIRDILQKSKAGKKVEVLGWVYRKREMKDKIFLVIRDSTDIVQAVVIIIQVHGIMQKDYN